MGWLGTHHVVKDGLEPLIFFHLCLSSAGIIVMLPWESGTILWVLSGGIHDGLIYSINTKTSLESTNVADKGMTRLGKYL